MKVTDQQRKLGYYSVGNQEYFSKIDACIAGTQQNIHPQWHFNDAIWRSMDWSVEPELSILDLYKMRARQIRERYDYVLVYYSGGSDSQTVIESFIDAGCHIDEVVTVWNRSYDRDYTVSKEVTDPENVEAEFELTTKPGLDWITRISPKTKITYQDISTEIVDSLAQVDGEEWISRTMEHLNPQLVVRYGAPNSKHQKLLLDRGKQTAFVYGVDKPKICIKDKKYHAYFVDVIANNFKGSAVEHDYVNLVPEFFYWSADLPEIVVKQAHMVKTWFKRNPSLEPVLAWPNFSWSHRNTYEMITRSIIYPNWDLGRFQAEKTRFTVYCEWDHWFFKHFAGTKSYAAWNKGLDYVQKNVDRKYLSYMSGDTFNGFVGMINGFFCLEN